MQSDDRSNSHLPHATDRLDDWITAWREAGRFVLLLDFDGTLAPIVRHADMAALPERTRVVLDRLGQTPGLEMAVVSGRGMADVREKVGIGSVAYAGNHGMEIEGPDISRRHEEAEAARPELERVIERAGKVLENIEGAWIEDKGVTLSVHYRETPEGDVPRVREAVESAVAGANRLKLTRGKKVLEVRPDVDWHKGRAVEFLLDRLDPPSGTPVLYIGDDTTDEDAFRALEGWRSGGGEGVVVGDPPDSETAARSFVRSPEEVADLLERLADRAGPT